MPAPPGTPKNGSVGKAFQILTMLGASGRDMSATEMAQAVGSNLATTHRFLVTLEELGAVARTPQGRFQLGLVLADLGAKVESHKLLVDAVQPALDALAASFREVAHCAVRTGSQAVNVARALPDRSLMIDHPVGEMAPLHCTAVGKALLAGLDPALRDRLIDRLDLDRFTQHTLTDRTALRRDLAETARRHHAVDDEEWEEGVRSIAVALRNGKGQPVAALALSAPASRLDPPRLAEMRAALADRAGALEHTLFTASRVFPQKARPRGSFPHLKQVGDFIFVSGTSARRPDDSFEGVKLGADGTIEIDIARQTRVVLANIGDMLRDVGARLDDLVEIQAYLTDMRDYDAFNRAYGEFFTVEGPARTTVGVSQLPHPHQGLMIRAVAYAPHARFDDMGG